jgi:hypothetical protein
MKGTAVLNSGALFAIAKRASQRVKEEDGGIIGPVESALVALLFSAATLEGYISEVAFISRAVDKLAAHPPLASLLSLVDEVEDSRGSVRLKYLMARVALHGRPFDKGAKPHQDLDLLFRLRDAVVHLKPDNLTGSPQKLLEQLRSRGLVDLPEEGAAVWMLTIATPEVARWACDTVGNTIRALFDAVDVPEDLASFNKKFTDG